MDYQKETAAENVMAYDRLEGLFAAPALSMLREQALGKTATAERFICRRCTSPGG
jgi:hypothetical protein